MPRAQSTIAIAAAGAALTGVAVAFSWIVTPAAPREPAPPSTPPAAAAPAIPPAPASPAPQADTVPREDARPVAPNATGAAVFDRACATCHTVERLRAALRSRTDLAATRHAWLTLLERHGDSSDAEDREVIAFLVNAANQP